MIQSIFYNTNNYKWSITFKNYESLYGSLVTYIILCINYTSILYIYIYIYIYIFFLKTRILEEKIIEGGILEI